MKGFEIERKITAESLLDVLQNDATYPNNRLRRLKKWAQHQLAPAEKSTTTTDPSSGEETEKKPKRRSFGKKNAA